MRLLAILSFLSQAAFGQLLGHAVVVGHTITKRIIFDGNSLTNSSGSLIVSGQRYPGYVYSHAISDGYVLSYHNPSIGGKATPELTTDFLVNVGTYVNSGDIVIFWEITNDAHNEVSDTGGTLLHSNVQAYCLQARAAGAKVVVLTGIARDFPAFDDANITDRIMACNVLIRANWTNYADLLVDVGALSMFDQKTDTTNATYYNTSDRTHLTNTGYDVIGDAVFTALDAVNFFN